MNAVKKIKCILILIVFLIPINLAVAKSANFPDIKKSRPAPEGININISGNINSNFDSVAQNQILEEVGAVNKVIYSKSLTDGKHINFFSYKWFWLVMLIVVAGIVFYIYLRISKKIKDVF